MAGWKILHWAQWFSDWNVHFELISQPIDWWHQPNIPLYCWWYIPIPLFLPMKSSSNPMTWNPHKIPFSIHFSSIFPAISCWKNPGEPQSLCGTGGRSLRSVRPRRKPRQRSERPSSRGPWRPQLGDFLLTLGISWDFTDWPWDIWVISYYSWDNFDEKNIAKNILKWGSLGFHEDFTYQFFQWRSYRSTWTGHLGYHLWRRDFVARLGRQMAGIRRNPKESEGSCHDFQVLQGEMGDTMW